MPKSSTSSSLYEASVFDDGFKRKSVTVSHDKVIALSKYDAHFVDETQ